MVQEAFSSCFISTGVCVCPLCCSVTHCDLMDCSLPGSSVHGIFQARILGWVAISYSRGSSWPKGWNQIFCVSCIGSWILRQTYILLRSRLKPSEAEWFAQNHLSESLWLEVIDSWGCSIVFSFLFFVFNYNIIALQRGVSFCCTMGWISYVCIHVPSPSCTSLLCLLLPPPPLLQPLTTIPPLLVITEHQAELPVLREQVLTSYLFYTRECVYCFHYIFQSNLSSRYEMMLYVSGFSDNW